MLNLKNIGKSSRALPLVIFTLLLSLVAFISAKGIPYKIAFVAVFAVVYFLSFAYINKRLVETYGELRAIKLFVYGFGFVAYLTLILVLTEPDR